MKNYYVYILATKYNKMLYIGVTNNLERRVWEHKSKQIAGYTYKYNVDKLVWFEEFSEINDAIAVEKKLKGWLRVKKDQLISEFNPEWKELYPSATPQDDSVIPQDDSVIPQDDSVIPQDDTTRTNDR
jgi:putative endonuclease